MLEDAIEYYLAQLVKKQLCTNEVYYSLRNGNWKGRGLELVMPKHAIRYLLYTNHSKLFTMVSIAQKTGIKDHSALINSLNFIKDLNHGYAKDKAYFEKLCLIVPYNYSAIDPDEVEEILP
ncbi:MAG: hypothetical protein EBR82_88195 [Caulobacteraceae bacterium]|nr:hypothetical protein [Caulobacteraceae bacterium]